MPFVSARYSSHENVERYVLRDVLSIRYMEIKLRGNQEQLEELN
jgi:hypothetical protein